MAVSAAPVETTATETRRDRPCCAFHRGQPCPNEARNTVLTTCPCGHLGYREWCHRHVSQALVGAVWCLPCCTSGCEHVFDVVSIESLSDR